MSIEIELLLGLIAGLLIGVLVVKEKVGCLCLLAVPLAMFVYVAIWQEQHPENIRSTSGLDFVFGPLWPSLAAVCGYAIGLILRSTFSGSKRRDD